MIEDTQECNVPTSFIVANQLRRAQRAPVLQWVRQPGEGLGPIGVSGECYYNCQRERADTTGKSRTAYNARIQPLSQRLTQHHRRNAASV
jgi:hypothetical protein